MLQSYQEIMKKKVFFVSIWIIGFFLISFLYLPKTKAFPLDYQIKAEVSSSIETLQVFYLLKYQSGYSQCEYENTIFKKLSLEWFTPFSGHKAVRDFNQNISTEYTQEELFNLFSQISFTAGVFDLACPSLKNDQKLTTWIRDVNDFLAESQSEVFFSRVQEYYNLLPTTLTPRTSFIITLERIMSFFNIKGCKIYITPTLMHQYYLFSSHDNNEITFTIILGLQSIQNGYIAFTTSELQQELLYTTMMNQCLELSLLPFQANIDKLSRLWPSIKDSMHRDKIETWSKAFQEHMRIGLLYKLFPEPYTVSLFQQKTEYGYQYLPFTVGVIEEYLRQRTFFQSFDSLMTKALIRFSKYPA